MYSHKSVEKPAKSYLGKALRGCPCSKLQGLSPLVSSASKPQGRGVANGYIPLRQKLQKSEATVWRCGDSNLQRVKSVLLSGMAVKSLLRVWQVRHGSSARENTRQRLRASRKIRWWLNFCTHHEGAELTPICILFLFLTSSYRDHSSSSQSPVPNTSCAIYLTPVG